MLYCFSLIFFLFFIYLKTFPLSNIFVSVSLFSLFSLFLSIFSLFLHTSVYCPYLVQMAAPVTRLVSADPKACTNRRNSSFIEMCWNVSLCLEKFSFFLLNEISMSYCVFNSNPPFGVNLQVILRLDAYSHTQRKYLYITTVKNTNNVNKFGTCTINGDLPIEITYMRNVCVVQMQASFCYFYTLLSIYCRYICAV